MWFMSVMRDMSSPKAQKYPPVKLCCGASSCAGPQVLGVMGRLSTRAVVLLLGTIVGKNPSDMVA